MQNQMWSVAFISGNFDLHPTYIADAGTQRLGHSFLGRKSRGKRGCTSITFALFPNGKDTIGKLLAMTIDGFLNSNDLDQINSACKIHSKYRNYGPAVAITKRSGYIYLRAVSNTSSRVTLRTRLS